MNLRGKWIRPQSLRDGQRVLNWTVVHLRGSTPSTRLWECVCLCGTRRILQTRQLTSARPTPSRGCLSRHGESDCGQRRGSAEYRIWRNIITRCFNVGTSAYKWYGARGITMDAAWRASFPVFLAAVGRRPSDRHSLDRYPDKNGNYESGNVRWANPTEQARNTRRNVVLEHLGQHKTVAEWAEVTGILQATIHYRIKSGWPASDALTIPVQGSSAV